MNTLSIKLPRVHVMAPPASRSWHNDMLALSEQVIMQHAPALIACRRQLSTTANHGAADSPWLQQVDRFIDNVLEASGAHVNGSPELLRAVHWMIASATAQFAHQEVPIAPERDTEFIAAAA